MRSEVRERIRLIRTTLSTEVPRARRRWRRVAWLSLGALTVEVLLGWKAWEELVGTPAFYTVVSRQIAETGGWVPLMHGDAPYVLKPPLLFWLTAATVKLAGVSTLSATLWPRIFGLVCVALTALLARRLVGPTAAFFAALILFANGVFISGATELRMETGVLAGILASAVALVARRGAWRPPLFYGGIAVATLIKGPAGLLPLALAPLLLVGSGRWRRAPASAALPWLAWSAVLLLPIVWVLWLEAELGARVLGVLAADLDSEETAGLSDRLGRFFRGYLARPLGRGLPFSPFVLWGVGRAVVNLRREPRREGPAGRRRRTLRFLIGWIAIVGLALAVKETIKTRYVILALPPLAILGGRELARLFRGRVPAGVAAALTGLAILSPAVLVAWQSPRAREEAESMATFRRAVERTWPDPGEPFPQLASPAYPKYRFGAPWPAMDWSLLHLGRPIRVVSSQRLAETGDAMHDRFLVFLPEREGMPPGIRWRMLVRTRHAALVELLR